MCARVCLDLFGCLCVPSPTRGRQTHITDFWGRGGENGREEGQARDSLVDMLEGASASPGDADGVFLCACVCAGARTRDGRALYACTALFLCLVVGNFVPVLLSLFEWNAGPLSPTSPFRAPRESLKFPVNQHYQPPPPTPPQKKRKRKRKKKKKKTRTHPHPHPHRPTHTHTHTSHPTYCRRATRRKAPL